MRVERQAVRRWGGGEEGGSTVGTQVYDLLTDDEPGQKEPWHASYTRPVATGFGELFPRGVYDRRSQIRQRSRPRTGSGRKNQPDPLRFFEVNSHCPVTRGGSVVAMCALVEKQEGVKLSDGHIRTTK